MKPPQATGALLLAPTPAGGFEAYHNYYVGLEHEGSEVDRWLLILRAVCLNVRQYCHCSADCRRNWHPSAAAHANVVVVVESGI
jgi:hypothetical protein